MYEPPGGCSTSGAQRQHAAATPRAHPRVGRAPPWQLGRSRGRPPQATRTQQTPEEHAGHVPGAAWPGRRAALLAAAGLPLLQHMDPGRAHAQVCAAPYVHRGCKVAPHCHTCAGDDTLQGCRHQCGHHRGRHLLHAWARLFMRCGRGGCMVISANHNMHACGSLPATSASHPCATVPCLIIRDPPLPPNTHTRTHMCKHTRHRGRSTRHPPRPLSTPVPSCTPPPPQRSCNTQLCSGGAHHPTSHHTQTRPPALAPLHWPPPPPLLQLSPAKCRETYAPFLLQPDYSGPGPLRVSHLPRLEHTCASCFPACVGTNCIVSTGRPAAAAAGSGRPRLWAGKGRAGKGRAGQSRAGGFGHGRADCHHHLQRGARPPTRWQAEPGALGGVVQPIHQHDACTHAPICTHPFARTHTRARCGSLRRAPPHATHLCRAAHGCPFAPGAQVRVDVSYPRGGADLGLGPPYPLVRRGGGERAGESG